MSHFGVEIGDHYRSFFLKKKKKKPFSPTLVTKYRETVKLNEEDKIIGGGSEMKLERQ